jgi:hypothetical protein
MCTTCNNAAGGCPCCQEEPEEEMIICECGMKGNKEFFHETPEGLLCEMCFQIYKIEQLKESGYE